MPHAHSTHPARDALNVCETFTSIQGESTHAGRLCFFIRLAGCNLKCSYCDTPHAHSPSDGRPLAMRSLVRMALDSGLHLVEITGGEPLLQPATPALCAALIEAGLEVLVETNGSIDISILPPGAIRIMDVKGPSSGEANAMLPSNLTRLGQEDELKFVIATRDDYCHAVALLRDSGVASRVRAVLFSAAHPALPPRALAEWMIEDKPPARLQVQLHKILWHPDARGV